MRIKITVIALLLELILLAWQKPLIASAAVKMIEKVQQVIPVTLQEPAQFWRAGKQEEANEAVILKMKINLPFDWFTRNSEPPQFLFGHAVCHLLTLPSADGVVVLLAPLPKPGEPVVVSIAPGISPQKLDEKFLRDYPPSLRGTPVTLPAATVKLKNYRNLLELRREIAPIPGERDRS